MSNMGKSEEENDKMSSISAESQASKLLEQALMEMDGIISGNNSSSLLVQNSDCEFNSSIPCIEELADNLSKALQNCSEIQPPDQNVAKILSRWLQMLPEHSDAFRKMKRQSDNCQLEVQVLMEQIEAQGDKITDLEKLLLEKKQQLIETESELQREILSRSSLETQKLELMSIISELKLQMTALEKENVELKRAQFNNNIDFDKITKKIPKSPNVLPTRKLSNGQTPSVNFSRQIDIHYGSLPRQQFLNTGNNLSVAGCNEMSLDSPNKGIHIRGNSVPNLAEKEKLSIGDSYKGQGNSPSQVAKGGKGIRKIFNKMKRSGSGNLEDTPEGTFERGGVRATATARLGWSEQQMKKPDKPFSDWDTEEICCWLQDLGLDQYVSDAKKWVKDGQQMQEASITDVEKNLNLKNHLHRKKLQLALTDMEENGSSDSYLQKAGKLDTAWVLRWLDDIGLPQHKENFLINRVDGRVLHRLTTDDLVLLHVTTLLHVSSIKRGIQVLRQNNFTSDCLQRRSLPESSVDRIPEKISLWTTHRVMEWLKSVDLAEYAPNLRGAGVHGGLMVYEPKFTAELLATLLSIPPEKTLLRRHLNTQFKELLGKDIVQLKREAASVMGYIPLTPSAKLKVQKKSQFTLKRKRSKGEADYGDLVCPLDPANVADEEDGKPASRGCLV